MSSYDLDINSCDGLADDILNVTLRGSQQEFMASKDYSSPQHRRQTRSTGEFSETKAGFEKRIAEYYDYLFRGVLRLTHDKTEAEGITQAALLRFLHKMEKRDWNVEIKNTPAYLMTIAKHIWKERKRKTSEGPVSYDDEENFDKLDHATLNRDDSLIDIEKRIYYEELLRALPLNSILGGLSDYEAQLFQLRRMDEMSIHDIASEVKKDPEQVRYDLQKIEARIRFRVRKLVENADRQMLGVWKEIHHKRDKVTF